jgi:acyl-homoserine-lactone acylase
MTSARSLTEFEPAIRRMQVSGFNLIYADRDGHIMYHYGGTSPVRPSGDRAYWAGIVSGESSATLWTRLHGYDEMPRVVDPPSGWLQNANDPPWWTTFPPTLAARDFPSYLAPSTMSFRAQRSARMLAEKPSISFEELVASKHSTRMELADRLLEELLAAAQANRSETARRAAGVLGRWDRSADGTSRGAVLFDEWWREVGRRTAPGESAFLKPWTDTSPRDTPAGLADPATAVAALEAAAKTIESRYGSMDIQWGDVYRLRQDRVDLPSNGAPGNLLGVFRTVWYDSAAEHQFQAAGGDSYVAAIEFGTPIRAMAILAYGNWSQLGSGHRTDQLALFAGKALRPVWRTRAEVEAHLESRERF